MTDYEHSEVELSEDEAAPIQQAATSDTQQVVATTQQANAKRRKTVNSSTAQAWLDPTQGGFSWAKFVLQASKDTVARVQCVVCLAANKNNEFTKPTGGAVHNKSELLRHAKSQQQARIEVKKKFMAEADAFAKHMISVVKSNPLISFVDAWKFLLSDRVRGHILFPNFTQLFYIALVTPVHTATVERGFSIHRVLKNRLSNKLKLTTLDSLMRIKMIVDRDAWTKHDLSSAVAVYTKQHPRSEKAPALLAKLHVAFNEGAQWPECLADAGVGAFDEFELDGIDVEVDSDEDFDPGDDTDMDDDAAWALAGLVEEGDMVAALAAPDVTQHDSDDFMLEDADGDL